MGFLDSAFLNIFASRMSSSLSEGRQAEADSPLSRRGRADDIPLLAGDIIYCYLEEAEQKLPGSRILELAEKYGLGRFASLEDFKSNLDFRLEYPEERAQRFIAELVKAGVPYEKAVLNILVDRVSPGMYYRGLFSVLSGLASHPLGGEWLDPVSLAYFLMGRYEHINCNSVSVDALLEKKLGNERRARVIYLHLDQVTANWFVWHHTFQVARHYPSIFGEAPAKVSHRFAEEFVFSDSLFGGEPLRIPARPSLSEIAHRLGARLEHDGPLLLLNGEPIAVPDHHPDRVRGEGIYRVLRDVRLDGGRLVMEEPRALVRRYHDLVLVKDHRYHLTRSIPVFEFVCDYRVHRPRHLVLTLFAKACSLAWRLFTSGEDGDLWGELLFLLEHGGDGGSPGLWEKGFSFPEFSSGDGSVRSLSVSERLLVFGERHGLSVREREVLERLVEGKSNREIAQELFISERTVKSHVASILRKSGLASRSRLIAEIMWW